MEQKTTPAASVARGQVRPVVVKLDYRNCIKTSGMTVYAVYSFKQRKILEAHKKIRSSTGVHGQDAYYLMPGVYGVIGIQVSSSGQHHCENFVLRISTTGLQSQEGWIDPPARLLEQYCKECWGTIIPHE